MAKIAVLGAGAWGTALAMHISNQHQVVLWARNAGHVSGMRKARSNPMYLGDFQFNDNLQVEDNLGAEFKTLTSFYPLCQPQVSALF